MLGAPVQTPIDGKSPEDPSTPIGALSEFYRAFNTRDLALMESNWEQSGEAAMDNPLGGIKRGWQEIRSVYERVFQGSARVEVEFYDIRCTKWAMCFGLSAGSAGRSTHRERTCS